MQAVRTIRITILCHRILRFTIFYIQNSSRPSISQWMNTSYEKMYQILLLNIDIEKFLYDYKK